MRSAVIVTSSVNSSRKNSRTTRTARARLEMSPSRGPRPSKAPSRTVKPQSYQRVIHQQDVTEQFPFPRFDTTARDPSVRTISRDGRPPPTRATNTTSGVKHNVVHQEGVLTHCFSSLKHIGATLFMPPYAIDEGSNNINSRRRGYFDLNYSVTDIPLV